jgi:lambda repressor-like predicted transcriptional regulator
MNIKKITSLTMLLAMSVMVYSGLILFIAPPGRIANWANWEIFALTKDQYANLHSSMMVLFIATTILHLYYNWTPITSYMKNQAKQMIIFTKEMVLALVLVVVFAIGSLAYITPFSSFLDFGQGVKDSWEKSYGTAPYSHAELNSFKSFCKKLGFDLVKSEEILKSNNIKYELAKSLSQIGKENGVSPQFIFNLLRKNFEKSGQKIATLTGLGKKEVKDVAISLGLSTKEFIDKLKTLGIDAKPNDKFKEASEKYDMSPMDIVTKLGYKKAE